MPTQVSKCLKCGAELPLLGDCPACAGEVKAPPRPPALLSRELPLDRRSPARQGSFQLGPPDAVPAGAPPPPDGVSRPSAPPPPARVAPNPPGAARNFTLPSATPGAARPASPPAPGREPTPMERILSGAPRAPERPAPSATPERTPPSGGTWPFAASSLFPPSAAAPRAPALPGAPGLPPARAPAPSPGAAGAVPGRGGVPVSTGTAPAPAFPRPAGAFPSAPGRLSPLFPPASPATSPGASAFAPPAPALPRAPTPPRGTPVEARRSREVFVGLPPPEEGAPAVRAALLPEVPSPAEAAHPSRPPPPGPSPAAWQQTDPQYKRAAGAPASSVATGPVLPSAAGARAGSVSAPVLPSTRVPGAPVPSPVLAAAPAAEKGLPPSPFVPGVAPSVAASPSFPSVAPVASPPATLAQSFPFPEGPAELAARSLATPGRSAAAFVQAPTPAPAPARVESELEALPRLPAAVPGEREVRARPASLWRRAGALRLDSTIVVGVFALFMELALLIVRPAAVRGAELPGLDGLVARLHAVHTVLPPALVLGALLAVVYSSVFAFLWGGRSPGRWLFGIRLVDRRGVAPAPGRALARALLGLVSFGLCLAGFWLALFDRRGQTLHDKLTRTFVVRPG